MLYSGSGASKSGGSSFNATSDENERSSLVFERILGGLEEHHEHEHEHEHA